MSAGMTSSQARYVQIRGRMRRKRGKKYTKHDRVKSRAARTRIPTAMRGYVRTTGYYGEGSDEMKFHDLDINDATVATGGTISAPSCLLIAQGAGESQRIGRKCVVKKIGWRFTLSLPDQVALAPHADIVRVILYLDKQCNGAAATTTQILEVDQYQSFNNLANKKRFRTLMDRTYDLNAIAGAYDGADDKNWQRNVSDSFYKDCNIPIEYDGATGAITEIRSNNIGVLLVGVNAQAIFASKMRVRFEG